ncbi:MAG TPA: hypothetical protein VLU25_02420 [Acidobacteriota bacterium]|nr:hypothetical protein [Acidobacteriota bacterium]
MDKVLSLLLTAALVCALAASAAAQSDADQLLLEIKVALFDQNWEEALGKARRLQRDFPDDRRKAHAIYYEADALQGLERRAESLRRFEAARQAGLNDTLEEQARLSIIDLAVELWQQGDTDYIGRALDELGKDNRRTRYYAALRLSYVDDKSVASRAVPVLREILEKEADEDLRNRATLALLRIDPRLSPSNSGSSAGTQGRRLRIKIEADGEEVVSLSLPLSLARALFQAIPRDAKDELERNGIGDAEKLLEELLESKTNVLEFRSSDRYFRIWIE